LLFAPARRNVTVLRELALKGEHLKARAGLTTDDQAHKSKDKSPKFLSLKAPQLASITNDVKKNSKASNMLHQ
jgi:hypothetical protein